MYTSALTTFKQYLTLTVNLFFFFFQHMLSENIAIINFLRKYVDIVIYRSAEKLI